MELLTSEEWFALDPEKLYITVYPKDTDAKKIWLEAGVKEDHIYEDEDNFWISAKVHLVLTLRSSTIVGKR
ncbi:hypothetical protein C822_002241 [Ligilactobacillus murinus ASF361]|nr:hypothetical protein C822_002241 [Ligilactobacillus murinus ASF361]